MTIASILLALLLLIAIALLAKLFASKKSTKAELDLLQTKYSGILDIDAYCETKLAESNLLQKEMESLQEKYSKGKIRYETLVQEVSILEESNDLMDFGLYVPRYSLETSDEYKIKLDEIFEKQKEMIKADKAIICSTDWTINGSIMEGKKMTRLNMTVMLRAFNGECSAAIASVKWNNVTKMEARIRKSYSAINDMGQKVNKISITYLFMELKIEELQLHYELAEKLKQEKEEQRRIQEEIREEEKARRDFEKAIIDAERDEERYKKALEKAQSDILKLDGEKSVQMENRIRELELAIENSANQKQRAISQAQLTKSGYVYIISNIGSFGDNVYKIGMTRRLDPMDRVKELGDASVPFTFDVHAMIYSDNAPHLESQFHKDFSACSVNLINMRKEFFKTDLLAIENWAKDKKLEFRLTKVAEAKEYRESQKLRNLGTASVLKAAESNIPEAELIFDD